MDKTISAYLAELRKALAGADPALIQDALFDAEEYLRDAMAESGGASAESFDAAVAAYGAPDEVASAYRDIEPTIVAALRAPRPKVRGNGNALTRFLGVVADPAAWGALFYLLLALATGVVYFTIVIAGVSITLSTLILVIGVPMALLTLAVVRAISLAEGRMVEGLLGVRMPRRPRAIGAEGNVWMRVKSWLTDYRTWTTMLYMVLQLPLGILYFTITVVSLAVSLALVAAPLVQVLFDVPIARSYEYGYYIQPWGMPLFVIAGIIGLLVTLWVVKGIGALHGQYAKVMLVGRVDQPAVAMSTGSPVMQAVAPMSGAAGAEGGDAS